MAKDEFFFVDAAVPFHSELATIIMPQPFISDDDIPTWSGLSLRHDGYKEYELHYGPHGDVSMMQAMVGQGGPTLEARSGSCLIISIYAPVHRAGVLIHLWRDSVPLEGSEAADLIRKPFEQFPQLSDKPVVHLLTNDRLDRESPDQIPQVKSLIESVANGASFKEILAADNLVGDNCEIGVKIELDTRAGLLIVTDDFGEDRIIDYHARQLRLAGVAINGRKQGFPLALQKTTEIV